MVSERRIAVSEKKLSEKWDGKNRKQCCNNNGFRGILCVTVVELGVYHNIGTGRTGSRNEQDKF